jgi:membrane protease YdiL (CAAX protease family)
MSERDALKVIPWFVVVFAITWALWFTAAGLEPSLLRNVSFYLGVFAPGIVALAMTYRELGASGVRKLIGQLVQWDVGVRWFAFALLFIFSIKVVVALIVRVSTGGWPVFGTVPVPLLFAGAIGSTLFGGQVGEELGWRGYALPRLASAMGLGAASVLLGVIWAIWHLPLFYILGADTVGQSFPFYLLQVTALSVAIAWLYMKTRGSLLLAMLLHAAVNNTKDVVPSAVPGASDPWLLHASMVGWLTLSLLWLCAIGFLVDMRRSGSGNLQRDDEGNIVG